ncbi:chromosome-associated kinesin KIF4 isoform X3 [Temnothorax nylanderi]|uniref:chromosome-associated kinesin KIF4 isoform X3 n=1 Tax=Temnothorax nylanderi TaxID=102681 RepID=UPI003A883A23
MCDDFDDTVRVALRIRPLVESELEKGCQACLDTVPGEHQVRICNTDKAFTYNYVFPPHVGQEDFYNTAIKRLVDNTFQGYNVTILAYGQTGSGKTHSMGTNYTGVGEKGIIPRVIYDIFEIIESKEDWNFKVAVSFMELYQEQLYDLLSDKQRSQSIVDIREDGKSIRIVSVTEKQVANAQETLECLAQGSTGRVRGATAMNAHTSRSHAIFTLCIRQQKRDDPNTATVAKFHLVDLAGSERSKKTQATGERFKEGVNINKGLLALGNVISQLGDGASGTYIGYRDSKLTRLLQDSLGGNSMTLMVACVSPADYNLDETLSTLRYADRARKIKNKPIVNQDPKVAEINRLNKLVQELRLALMSQELGITCPKEHEALEENNRVLQHKLKDMTEKYRNLEARLEEYEKRDRVNKMSRPRDTSDTSSSYPIETLTKSERQEQEETERSLAEQRRREQEAEKRREAEARAQQAADDDKSDDESRPKHEIPHKTFKCPECPKTYTNRENKNRHNRVEHEKQRFQCKYCSRKPYKRNDYLKKHMKDKHPEKEAE